MTNVAIHTRSDCARVQPPTGNYEAAMTKLLQARLIEPTIPDKPNSCLRQYRMSKQGKTLLK